MKFIHKSADLTWRKASRASERAKLNKYLISSIFGHALVALSNKFMHPDVHNFSDKDDRGMRYYSLSESIPPRYNIILSVEADKVFENLYINASMAIQRLRPQITFSGEHETSKLNLWLISIHETENKIMLSNSYWF